MLQTDVDALKQYDADIAHLQKEFERMAKGVDGQEQTLIELNGMKRENRTTIITVLVTLYVPISLACVRTVHICSSDLR